MWPTLSSGCMSCVIQLLWLLRSSSCIRLPMFLAHSGRRLRGNARRGHKIIASGEECAYVVGSVARERQRTLLMLSALPCHRSHNSVPVMSSAYSRGEWQDIKRGSGGSDQILFMASGNHRAEGPRRIALGLDMGVAHQSATLVAANGGRPGFRVLFLGLLFFVFRSSAVVNPQEKLRNLLWSS